MTSGQYFLGIDGGQSSTTALIGDESGRVVGYGRGGPCNHVSGPEARTKFMNAIGGCVRSAAIRAGLSKLHFAAVCAGFSGGAEDKAFLLDEMFTADKRFITHDGLIALSGATGGEPGVMVISGTGSIAFGRNAAGKTMRAGGWGYVFGDEGGGYSIAREAIRASLRMEEGWGPDTSLRLMLLGFTGSKDANELLHRLYTDEFSRPQIAAYSKLVDAEAAAGDQVAKAILDQAATHLSGYARAVRDTLFGPDATHIPVRPVGGVFKSPRLRAAFSSRIETAEPRYLPAAGALLEAYRLANWHVLLSEVPTFEK
jgi:N-acetylglucosamine kinase-like BadF-type ATPase